jgi:uncharacterized membrane protein YraQ (UPF0718 family)
MSAAHPERGPRLSGRMKFLLAVLAAYAATWLVRPNLVLQALAGFQGMVLKVLPILGLVFVALLLINLFLDPARIRRHLGAESGLGGWLYAIIGGIFISGPPYVLYPMLAEFRMHGAKNSLLAAFLYNRNVKIHFLPVMIYYFGLRYSLILSVYIILFSVVSGLLIEKLLD